MSESLFFDPPQPLSLSRIAEIVGVSLPTGVDTEIAISSVAPIDRATNGDLTFFENTKYLAELAETRATACLVSKRYADKVPESTVAIVVSEPYRSLAQIMAVLYPAAMRPFSAFGSDGVAPGAFVHPAARLESGVVVDPGAVVGPHAEIGTGSVVCAGAVIGPHVKIGRQCSIGMGTTIQHALVGNRVILHPGVRIGQDGFGFAMGPNGRLKMPQVGRVIIQDDVEIGANTTIDRGANRDTVIGEGTQIDNLVQIAHNVVIGRHCIIVSQVGISGSTTLEDFVVLGGQVGVVGHVRIGMGAQIAASSKVSTDVPPGVRWGGAPAKPMRDWFREITALKHLAERKSSGTGGQDTPQGG